VRQEIALIEPLSPRKLQSRDGRDGFGSLVRAVIDTTRKLRATDWTPTASPAPTDRASGPRRGRSARGDPAH